MLFVCAGNLDQTRSYGRTWVVADPGADKPRLYKEMGTGQAAPIGVRLRRMTYRGGGRDAGGARGLAFSRANKQYSSPDANGGGQAAPQGNIFRGRERLPIVA
ncbi:MAG TPA: hypothetical protein VGN34_30025 [Ktedonobacteraceae bacterium]